jgi:hypothetical protein
MKFDQKTIVSILVYSAVAVAVGMLTDMALDKIGFASMYRKFLTYALVSVGSLLAAQAFLPKQYSPA